MEQILNLRLTCRQTAHALIQPEVWRTKCLDDIPNACLELAEHLEQANQQQNWLSLYRCDNFANICFHVHC